MFDRIKLQEDIIETWGEFGAHNELFNDLLKEIKELKAVKSSVISSNSCKQCKEPLDVRFRFCSKKCKQNYDR
jgi:hypothetical protein